jgi:hypothetical protein
LGHYILTQFDKEEKSRHADAAVRTGTPNLDLNFVSSSPFITANGFRALCLPFVVDYNFTLPLHSQCKLSADMFRAVPNGACVYIASACFEQVVNTYLSLIPDSFTLVVHDGDQSNPGTIIVLIYQLINM